MDTSKSIDIDQKRGLCGVKPHIWAQSGEFPLRLLSDRHFEILCRDLLKVQAEETNLYDEVMLLPSGSDKGRDILLLGPNGTHAIVQCKRLATNLSKDQILGEIIKFGLHAVRDCSIFPIGEKPEYRFWTATGISKAAAKLFESEHAWHEALSSGGRALINATRNKYVALSSSGSPPTDEAENQQALKLAALLRPVHVGAEQINLLLSRHGDVRRLHFRSPEDGPQRATTREVETLLTSRRERVLRKLAAHNDPYVPREGLQEAFDDFLQSECRGFSLIGASGQGKSSWACKVLTDPPPTTQWK
ncbi:MAG: hypothetical protein PGN12_01810 [Sphingomonas phyllosphaerae]